MNHKKLFPVISGALALAILPTLTSCQTATGQGAGIGAAAGGLAAAIFGDDRNRHEDVVKAAAIGAAVGGLTGAYIDNKKRNAYPTHGGDGSYQQYPPQQQQPYPPQQSYPPRQNAQNYPPPQQQYPPQQQQQQYQPPQQQAPPQQQQYPVGTATNKPTVVLSPYPPHRKIDVTGFQRGELVIDPTTNKIFRIP